jgi:hypothetical protein
MKLKYYISKLIILCFLCIINTGFVRYDNASKVTSYPESRVGCFSKFSSLLKLNCSDQVMAFDILKTLRNSRRKNSNKKMSELIVKRLKHYISNDKYDYYSVLTLMVFPVKNKEFWLAKFEEISKENSLKIAPFHKIALDRIKGKKSRYCIRKKNKKLPYALREICSLSIYKS